MCVRPMNVKGNVVPCGKCFECKAQDRNQWSIRIRHEIKDGYFVTLTYNEECNPRILKKKHLIDYLKRVREHERKHNNNPNIKYFAVGEYGDRFGRPHYHIIIGRINPDVLARKWKFGLIHIGEISDASIHYTTKYIQKNAGWKKDQKPKEIREFRIMSKGLGKPYLEKYGNWHIKNRQTYTVVNGLKYALPRYYRNKLFGIILKETIDETTGVINTEIIRDKIDISDIQQRNLENKLKKLIKLYSGQTKGEMEENRRKYYEKFNKMLEIVKLQRYE